MVVLPRHIQGVAADSITIFQYKMDRYPGFEKMIKPSGFGNHKRVEPFLSEDANWTSGMPAETFMRNTMQSNAALTEGHIRSCALRLK